MRQNKVDRPIQIAGTMQQENNEIDEMLGKGVLGLTPCHVCEKLKRTKNWIIESGFARSYVGLIRLHISRGIALFIGQPAMLTLPPCI